MIKKLFIFLLCLFFSTNLIASNEGFARNGQVEIFYKDLGPAENTPVILVMGLGGQLTYWPDYLLDYLIKSGYRPIIFDNRDVGLSTSFESAGRPNVFLNYLKFYLNLPIKSPYSLDDMSNDIIAILDNLDIEKSHLIGMSMGGMISQHVLINNPNRFYSYTQIASMVKAPDASTAPKGRLGELLRNRAGHSLSDEQRIDRAIEIYTLLGTGKENFNNPEFRQGVKKNIERSPNDTGFSRQLLAIIADRKRINSIQKIATPTLIIHGTLDPLIPISEGKRSHELIKNSSFIEIKDMGHLLSQEILEEFSEPLSQHLADNS